MNHEELSVDQLEEILEASRDLKVKDHSPKSIPKRAARLLAEHPEDTAPEIILKKKFEVEPEKLTVEDIQQHLNDKYGAIAEPKITSVNVLSASLGYDPEDDYSVKADYKLHVNWGYTPKAFGTEAEDYKISKLDIRAEEQGEEVVKALKKHVDLEDADNYRISGLVKKLPRSEKYRRKIGSFL